MEIVKYVKVIVPRLSSTKMLRTKSWHNDRTSAFGGLALQASRKVRMLGNRDKTEALWWLGPGRNPARKRF